MLNLDLTDIWRDMHPDKRRFTWRQSKPEIHCRFDFFLISQGLSPHVLATVINPGYKTDHSFITLSVNLLSNPRGPGYWKLNASFLGEDEYVNLIKATITEVQEEYKHDQSVNDSLLWEMVKLKVREKSNYYAKKKKKSLINNLETTLEEEIAKLEKVIKCEMISSDEKIKATESLHNKKTGI